MANDVNFCSFIGRLGADPETRYLPSGKAVVNMRIAVGSQWKDEVGNKQEKTEWVPIVVFGKLAEICGKYLVKGAQIYISGRFQTRQWEKDGQKRFSSEIVADQMQMLGSKDGNRQGPAYSAPGEGMPESDRQQEYTAMGGGFDDDIPFGPLRRLEGM